MSLTSLTHAEYYYFRTDPSYKSAFLALIEELHIALRVPFLEAPGGISAYMVTQGKLKGSVTGRSAKRRIRFRSWNRLKYLKQ